MLPVTREDRGHGPQNPSGLRMLRRAPGQGGKEELKPTRHAADSERSLDELGDASFPASSSQRAQGQC